MEFTKEQIEYLNKYFEDYSNDKFATYKEILNSLLKPARKKIVVEIEYEDTFDVDLYVKNNNLFPSWLDKINYKVTELPEGTWTDEDIIEMFKSYFIADNAKKILEKFKAKRKSK